MHASVVMLVLILNHLRGRRRTSCSSVTGDRFCEFHRSGFASGRLKFLGPLRPENCKSQRDFRATDVVTNASVIASRPRMLSTCDAFACRSRASRRTPTPVATTIRRWFPPRGNPNENLRLSPNIGERQSMLNAGVSTLLSPALGGLKSRIQTGRLGVEMRCGKKRHARKPCIQAQNSIWRRGTFEANCHFPT